MPKTVADDTGRDTVQPEKVVVSHTGVPLTRPVTFVFTLDPNAGQRELLASHAGAFRLAFNHQIGRVLANLDQRAAEKSYGVADADLTPSLSWSKVSLINHMNAWKDGREPDSPVAVVDGSTVRGLAWRTEVSADVFETAGPRAMPTWPEPRWRRSSSTPTPRR